MKKNKKGFTLIEVIMAIVLASVLALLVGPLLGVAIQSYLFHSDRVGLQESSDLAHARMSREIRRVKNDQSFVTATSDTLTFVNNDNQQIRYRLNGNSITRTQDAQAETVLVDNIQTNGLTFTYYDENGNEISSFTPATISNIRGIEIRIVFASNLGTLLTQTFVRPRNLRYASEILA